MQTLMTIPELMALMGVDLPPETKAKLDALAGGKDVLALAKEAAQTKAAEEAAKAEAVYKAIEEAVAEALGQYPEYQLPANGLKLNGEGKVIRPTARSTSGNGAGKPFGGGGGGKVRGPFIDIQTGTEYAKWHDVAVALDGHKCPAGVDAANCKAYFGVKAKYSGRVIPKASYTPPTPEVMPPITEEVMVESPPAPTLAEQLTQEPSLTPEPEKKGKKGKK